MLLQVQRFSQTSRATLSRVYLIAPYQDPAFLCHGLEDVWRAVKVQHKTRIPAGEYRLGLRNTGGFYALYAERFADLHQGMIEVQDVPGFTHILLHVGNTDEDTSGCLLLGRWQGGENFIGDSAVTYRRVYGRLAPLIASGTLTRVAFLDGDR